MKLGFRLKLFVVSLGLTVFAFLGADLWLAPSFERQMADARREDRRALVSVLALEDAARIATIAGAAERDALVRLLADKARARVTLTRDDGSVIADSGGDAGDDTMEFVTEPLRANGEAIGVLRLGFPLAARERTNDRIERIVLIESGVACAAAIVLWFGAAYWLARLHRRLADVARKMAGGDYDVRTHIAGTDEVAELGQALDTLAESLSVAVRELRDERDVQGAILDGMQEGVLLLDGERRVLRHNPAIRAMLLASSELRGKPLSELVGAAECDAILDDAADNHAGTEIDVAGLRPRRLLVNAINLPARPSTTLLVFRDVTDARRLETLRRDFVANVSHELRTPVASIRSAAETLRGAATRRPEASGRFIDMVSRNADRLQRLIDELLELSRIESKELDLRKEATLLEPFVAQVLSGFRERAEQRGVDLVADVPAGLTIAVDPHALDHVLVNLVDNAIKYCPKSTVRVEVTEDEDGVTIRVADSGPGIPEEHLPRLFERFYRVDRSRSRDLGGTGLGLSIVKHLVEAMGGTVIVESEVGRGTSFLVTLPRGEPAAPPSSRAPGANVSEV